MNDWLAKIRVETDRTARVKTVDEMQRYEVDQMYYLHLYSGLTRESFVRKELQNYEGGQATGQAVMAEAHAWIDKG